MRSRHKITTLIIWLAILCVSVNYADGIKMAFAAETIFEMNTTELITKGVTYEKSQRVTKDGLLDIHILKVPLNDPNISLSPAESQAEVGFKETVFDLLSGTGAIAGVNGDFFGLSGDYSAGFGPVFRDAELVSVTSGTNWSRSEYASFFIDNDNDPFIMYLKTDIQFLNNGTENIKVFSINKITDMVMPVLVEKKVMEDTSGIDARFNGLVKIIVENNTIKYISEAGETVQIPANGYIIVIGNTSKEHISTLVSVGQTAELRMYAGLDFTKIVTAIGGGGRILLDGEPVYDDGIVPKGRQPRTALGITADKSQLILMVVDGRTHSIGATREELAELMLSYGAYNAMNLDGGGSSTMAVKKAGEYDLEVVNTVSDIAQRKVINALGIYHRMPVGEMAKLLIEPENKRVFRNTAVKIDMYGIDDYYRRIDLPEEGVIFNNDDVTGYWIDGYYYPGRTGSISFIAAYGDIAAERSFTCVNLAELRADKNVIKTIEEEYVELHFTGIGEDGSEGVISSGVSFEVVPPELGHMEGFSFAADNPGKGYIKCSADNTFTYVEVNIGGRNEMLYDFEGGRQLAFSGYPSIVGGRVDYTSQEVRAGNLSALMTYTFDVYEGTEAAYMNFAQPLEIPGSPVGLKLSVFGDNSGDWLRGRIIDIEGREFLIDFAKEIDWEGWKTVQATMPANAVFPVRLDRVYAASLSNTENKSRTLYFDSLIAVYPLDESPVIIPESPRYKDPLDVTLDTPPINGSIDITLLGKMNPDGGDKPDNYASVRNRVLEMFKKDTTRGIYAGETDLPTDIGIDIYKWSQNYTVHEQGNVSIIYMTASKGGFLSTDPEQWRRFSGNIRTSGTDHAIIITDISPANFRQYKEYELFHKELANIREQTGKNIFVVSSDGNDTSSMIHNGVRYINLGGLWDSEGMLNDAFRILRFRIYGQDIRYELQGIY